MKIHLLLVIIGTYAAIVLAQTQEGFFSLDCGLPIEESPYDNEFNGLTFTSDSTFIQTGKSGRVHKDLKDVLSKQYLTLRYFPEGKRNCYSLDVKPDTKYLIAVSSVYGNYDGLNLDPNFDIYIGPNKWISINLKGIPNGTLDEIIHKSMSNSLDICLVKTGTTSPIISAIEIRPLRDNTYVSQSGSLRLSFRVYLNNSDGFIRYPDDVRDRIWNPFFDSSYSQITTNLNINNSNAYEVPKTALQSAATPRNASGPLVITWNPKPSNAQVYLYMHFAEIQTLEANEIREFDVILKGNFNHSGFSPTKLKVFTLFTEVPMQCDSGGCRLELVRTPKSTLPPLINALEAYTVIEFPKLETSPSDVDAIKNIKVTYRLSKISWQGDPCLPKDWSWENLRCNYVDLSTPPQIVSLNLSESGLTGSIAVALQNLTQLQELNFSGNNLNGSVPQALLDRVTEGLVLKLDGNSDLCKTSLCNQEKQKKKFLIPAFASAASLLAILVVVALIFVFRKNKLPSDPPAPPSIPVPDVGHTSQPESSFASKKIRFTFTEVQQMTNNFDRALGEGGFGVVYNGFVNVTQQVAVKLLSQSSSQGYKHFKAEVELLMKVHHINLVSLVGYCDEGDHLALIYEYMPNGDLKQHLSGKRGGFVLSWKNRLRIVLDTALGLEYLHTGCIPPIVHRDIKSTNILLDQNFQAKLADFGLSRSFPAGNETHVSTVVAGTPGYLDPEYYQTNWLTEKSDIYSFGIVLLEIITNRPIIQQSREKPHLVEWVSFMITKGDIGSIMDPNLHQNYDIGSVWKAIEISMSCLSPSSIGRPNMSQVTKGLKECLISENSRISESRDVELRTSMDYSKDMYTEVIPEAQFINLDCGLHPAASPYTEPLTGLTYTSDFNFTQGGTSGRVERFSEEAYKPFNVLRYFPEGIRNCYNLKVTSGTKYLIKAQFNYGNYDRLNDGPEFDLYLGPNKWTKVDLSISPKTEEIIHIPKLSSLQVCLVKTGDTTPIISALELRPLKDDTYITTNGSLKLLQRQYASNDFSRQSVRYPKDAYDREWVRIGDSRLNFINTSLSVNSSAPYELPQDVISKAVVNKNVTENLSFYWSVDNRDYHALIYLHFSEIQTLQGNDTREFDIVWKGNDQNITVSSYRPPKLQLETLYNTPPLKCMYSTQCTVELVMTQSSTLPPMINAMEAYIIMPFPDAGTNPEDAVAVQNVKDTYELNRIDWQGDPCVPRQFKWEGVNCSYTNASIPPRIISFTQGNPNLCLSGSCNNNKKVLVPVIASVASVLALIALLVLFYIFRKKRPLSEGAAATRELPRKSSIFSKKKRFTYSEVVELTDNFKRVLGEGGFGAVYHGSLSDTEPVAVKVLSESSVQGLEYLHVACEPPMVHRDVKSTNILLDDRFDAKLADFGLSRSFSVGAETQVVAGTSGYLDPEYYQTNRLNEKSDVYSFGIVLMEIITNRSVIERTRVKAHIAEWLKVLISRGDIEKIVDSNLGRDYDSNIAWKILELAISCVSHSSSDRPNMSKVVNVLKECLVSENLRTGGQIQDDDSKNFLQLTVDFGTRVTPDAR
uniref:Protein kinase domain-containing protein n=1 Tax=Brassica campestris TaxID=3711 RepID=M4F3K7_BRACM